MLKELIESKPLLEYILTGVFGIGFIFVILFSSPIEKLKQYYRLKVAQKEQKTIQLMEKANEPLMQRIDRMEKEDTAYREEQHMYHQSMDAKIDYLTDEVSKLKNSDQEQLRQLMDKIYDKRINEKRISYHEFERYQSLYQNYEAEGGNGKYETRWKEVQSWEKFR